MMKLRDFLRTGVLLFMSVLLAACATDARQSNRLIEPETLPPLTDKKFEFDSKPADQVSASDVNRRSRDKVSRTGEIYLMRGLTNVFSRGIDVMAKELRSRGYDASNFSYTEWDLIARDIIRRRAKKDVSLPIVIIGHSLGANESSKFANELARNNVPVSLVVAFDPVETGYVGRNIGTVINYYLPKSAEDNTIKATPEFTGELSNVDVTVDPDITHTNVEKHDPFHQATYKSIANITHRIRPVVAGDRRAPVR